MSKCCCCFKLANTWLDCQMMACPPQIHSCLFFGLFTAHLANRAIDITQYLLYSQMQVCCCCCYQPCSSRCNKMMENEFYRIVKVYLITAAQTRLAFQGSCSLSSSLSLSQFFQFYFIFYQEHADHHHHQQQHMPWNVVC